MTQESSLPLWHAKILEQIGNRLDCYFIADDPDCLLAEENLQKAFIDNGFDVYFYEDSIELRHFLSRRLDGSKPVVISINSNDYDVEALPFDILSRSCRLAVSLGDCFPDLSYSVLNSLQAEELNALDSALEGYTPGTLNETASSDFVLRHVFKLAPEIIQSSSDLLRSLLRLHYRDVALPRILRARFIELLDKRKQFEHWPLKDIVSSSKAFFSFLQRHWAGYVEDTAGALEQGLKEPSASFYVNVESEKSIVLPFDHDDVRIYIDNLFLEGYLAPVEVNRPDILIEHWCIVGVLQDPDKELKKRISGLLSLCEDSLPELSDRHQQWQQYAYRWAELSALFQSNKVEDELERYLMLQGDIDERFSLWLLDRYAGLHNHPPMPPVMLHHIPRAMAREVDSSLAAKSAVILIDGLAIEQWVTLRSQLTLDAEVLESAAFAWVPSVTSVSRQALFSGKAPYQFEKSIHTTSSEPKAWQQFWHDQGLEKPQVYYEKSLGTDDVEALIDRLSDRRLRAVGLVINTVDDMMHGMQLGAAGMQKLVKLWGENGYLNRLIEALLVKGFSIHITSDHGNVEAVGSGKINEGAIAESRGERTRVYETETLRDTINIECNDAIKWPPIGLPNNYWPIVMKGRKAFVGIGENIVGHGGIAIEEVIVPYVTIKRELIER
jgi:hypothetical protein